MGMGRAMKLQEAVHIYTVCAKTEGRSNRTIEWVTAGAKYLGRFLGDENIDIARIDAACLRRFIMMLRERPAYSGHTGNHVRNRPIQCNINLDTSIHI